MDKTILNSILLAFIPVYIVAVIVLRHYRQWLLYYLLATFGFTIIVTFLLKFSGVDETLKSIEVFHTNIIGNLVGIPSQALVYDRLQIPTGQGGWANLLIGIECSATLEMSALFGLLLFYPAFSSLQKFVKITFGLLATYIANIFRMLIILFIGWHFGSDYIFLAHAVVARIFFFIFVVFIYWYLITKPTIFGLGNYLDEGRRKVNAKTHLFEAKQTTQKVGLFGLFFLLALSALIVVSFWRREELNQALRKKIIPQEVKVVQAEITDNEEKLASNNQNNQSATEKIINYDPRILGVSTQNVELDAGYYLKTYVSKTNNLWTCNFEDDSQLESGLIYYLWYNSQNQEKLVLSKDWDEGESAVEGKEGDEWYCFASKFKEKIEELKNEQ